MPGEVRGLVVRYAMDDSATLDVRKPAARPGSSVTLDARDSASCRQRRNLLFIMSCAALRFDTALTDRRQTLGHECVPACTLYGVPSLLLLLLLPPSTATLRLPSSSGGACLPLPYPPAHVPSLASPFPCWLDTTRVLPHGRPQAQH